MACFDYDITRGRCTVLDVSCEVSRSFMICGRDPSWQVSGVTVQAVRGLRGRSRGKTYGMF